MRKKLKRPQLVKKLDKIFSKFIRLRDSELGVCQCITCGRHEHYTKVHAGHFVSRGVKTTRWDERNVHAQCCSCNTYKFGEQAKYLIALERKYGREVVDELMELERKYRADDYTALSSYELREMIEHYKQKVDELSE